MNILQEIEQNLEDTPLTSSQKAMLALVKTATTPEQAFEISRGSLKAQVSRNVLVKLGLISLDGIKGRVSLTSKGEEAVREYNLIDDRGQLTDLGNEIVNSYLEDNKITVQMESKNYPFLSELN